MTRCGTAGANFPIHGRRRVGNMDEQEFYERMTALLIEWSNGQGFGAAPTALDPDANLLDHGLLNSSAAVRALMIMEEWTGQEIDADRHGLWGFWTLREMYQIFTDGR